MKNFNRQYQMPKTSIIFIYLFLILLSLYDFGKIFTIVLKIRNLFIMHTRNVKS